MVTATINANVRGTLELSCFQKADHILSDVTAKENLPTENKLKIINRIFLSRTDKSDENKDSEKRLNRKNTCRNLGCRKENLQNKN